MRAYEFATRTTAEGRLDLPAAPSESLPPNQAVRVIVLVPELAAYDTDLTPEEEDALWHQLALAELLRQYGPEDEIYDQLEP